MQSIIFMIMGILIIAAGAVTAWQVYSEQMQRGHHQYNEWQVFLSIACWGIFFIMLSIKSRKKKTARKHE